MIVYDVVTKVLGTELVPQHNIANLNSGIYCFAQPEVFTVKESKHTHIHTHTHTHTHSITVLSAR